MEYHDALARLQQEDRVLPHDDPKTGEARQRFEQLFDAFTPEKLPAAVRTTYAADTYFNDSLRTVRDRATLARYLAGSAEAVQQCTVRVDEWTPAITGWYVRWRMSIRFRHFRRGTDTHSIGVSHIVFDRDGLVALHQDFWDAAGGFYEHLPVLGGLLRRIRQRL